jgi:hypothetical protein
VRDIKVEECGFLADQDEKLVARASRPLAREHPARALLAGAGRSRDRGRDAPATSQRGPDFTFMSRARWGTHCCGLAIPAMSSPRPDARATFSAPLLYFGNSAWPHESFEVEVPVLHQACPIPHYLSCAAAYSLSP